jgi:hypothetical protein
MERYPAQVAGPRGRYTYCRRARNPPPPEDALIRGGGWWGGPPPGTTESTSQPGCSPPETRGGRAGVAPSRSSGEPGPPSPPALPSPGTLLSEGSDVADPSAGARERSDFERAASSYAPWRQRRRADREVADARWEPGERTTCHAGPLGYDHQPRTGPAGAGSDLTPDRAEASADRIPGLAQASCSGLTRPTGRGHHR